MYTMVCTRPDLAHAISVASRYMGDLGKHHLDALKYTLKYMKGSSRVGIRYEKLERSGDSLIGFVNSDFATNLYTRKSQTSWIYTLFGSAISWKSPLQSVVALSTTEAEYIAITKAIKEDIWLKGILGEFGVDQRAVPLNCDNQSALHLAKHQVFHERSKHIDVRLHFVRDEVDKGVIKMLKISTDDNEVDMLTKVPSSTNFKYCMNLVGI